MQCKIHSELGTLSCHFYVLLALVQVLWAQWFLVMMPGIEQDLLLSEVLPYG